MVFLEGGKGGFQELADTSKGRKGGEESRGENCSEKSSGPPYACNNAAHETKLE